MKPPRPLRLRDFIEDRDGWIYSVATYDNAERAGCILRYVPDPSGDRMSPDGVRYRKAEFEESFDLVRREKPSYTGRFLRIPLADVQRVYKPEERLDFCAGRDRRVRVLADLFALPPGALGCTGSRLLGMESPGSDIDLVAYGRAFFSARESLRKAMEAGTVPGIPEGTWRTVYAKREPEISFGVFLAHEKRKWNRGIIGGTYFDLLFTRSYGELDGEPVPEGERIRRMTIEARVTDASLSFDSPSVYLVDHEVVDRIVSFTHTYSGQALPGEIVEAAGVLERHGSQAWLVVGTTRVAKGEYIISRTLVGDEG
ncbi:MAG TPA: DNA polymerase subunit beta [Methanomicrobiales archaeon]|nr:DNA polymerase subunit beta [Methanomicrobiales archaeon]